MTLKAAILHIMHIMHIMNKVFSVIPFVKKLHSDN